MDEHFTRICKEEIHFKNQLKDQFSFNLYDLKNHPERLRKINWICNCVKHKDGFPLKEKPPDEFTHTDKTKRIEVDQKQFEKDVLFLLDHYMKLFTTLLHIGVNLNFLAKIRRKENSEDRLFEEELITIVIKALLESLAVEEPDK